ncbi:amino acid ABC transporter permease [Paraburkholderia nemoris]|uniref:amino acid ABC transporter permease n=1 Tax=Paraburkholderia nemoris TaxID=2793076 RepID=UPI0038B922FE
MHFDFHYFFELLLSRQFFEPAWIAVWITVLAMVCGILIGTVAGLGAESRYAPIRMLVKAYLLIFRGTPVLVQVIFWYDALPEVTNNAINLSPIAAGLVALSVNEGAYMTEVVRSALASVDRGQREAAAALGLHSHTTFFRVIAPQAMRVALPPTGNQIISLLKNTSLLFTIAVTEIFATGTNIYSVNFKYFEVLAVVSVWYVGLSALYGQIQKRVERSVSKGSA